METYHEKLKIKIDEYVKLVYLLTQKFPTTEIYGMTSQLRRSALSVMLNYIEGYARRKGDACKVYQNFLEISYGSLKESKYIIYLSQYLKYTSIDEYTKLISLADEIGAMLYKNIK